MMLPEVKQTVNLLLSEWDIDKKLLNWF
jgi:hypothetical protein